MQQVFLPSAVRITQIRWAPKEQETGYLALHLSSIVHSFHHLKVTALPSPLHALRSQSLCVCSLPRSHSLVSPSTFSFTLARLSPLLLPPWHLFGTTIRLRNLAISSIHLLLELWWESLYFRKTAFFSLQLRITVRGHICRPLLAVGAYNSHAVLLVGIRCSSVALTATLTFLAAFYVGRILTFLMININC